MKALAIITMIFLSFSTWAAPALGKPKSILGSSFCAIYQCRWIGLNDSFDSFGIGHSCGVDYDFDHYRLEQTAALYQYRTLGDRDQFGQYDRRKNPVVGFQLLFGFTKTKSLEYERMMQRLLEYATGVKALLRFARLEQLYSIEFQRRETYNATHPNDLLPLDFEIELPIMLNPKKKSDYVLRFSYGAGRSTGYTIFIGQSGTFEC